MLVTALQTNDIRVMISLLANCATRTLHLGTVADQVVEHQRGAHGPGALASARMRLDVGDPAPSFSLADHHGEAVSLAELSGRPVLVYFYPKADTPGCTTQALGLQAILDGIGDTTIVGISPDPPERLDRFREKHSLSFALLSDPDHSVAEAYGVWVERSMYGRRYMGIERSAFLIGTSGHLEEVWYKVSPKDTAAKLTKALGARR